MQTNFFISPHGNDDNPGSESSPFGSIHRAQEAVRDAIRLGMTQDVTVYIRGGHYFMERMLKYDERDSGRDGFRVIYRSFPGEEPILTGGRVVTKWEEHSNDIWKSTLAPGSNFNTLYVDGARVTKARLPASGYFITDENAVGGKDGIYVRAGDIPEAADLSYAQVFVWPGEGEWNWFSETKAVSTYDPRSRRIVFQQPCIWEVGAGSRYYIQGSLDFLRHSGQYHLDEKEGILYYRPAAGRPHDQTVIAPCLSRLLELHGAEQPVENLVFNGLIFECTDFYREYGMMQDNTESEEQRDGLITINRACSIEISGCALLNSGSSGIFLDHYAQSITIDRNRIEGFGHTGINVSGFAPGEGPFASAKASYTNRRHVITNNEIRHGGQLVGHGSGIVLFQSGDNDVSHNIIEHMPRYGISLKGLRHKVMPERLYGIPVTWENHSEFIHTRNNRIAYNDISHVMEDSQDGGLIEAWGPGRGNIIQGNRLHHSGIHFSFGFGIYLDDAADDFLVTGNVLHDLYSTGQGKLWMLIFSKGIGNRIMNNLLVNNPDAIAAIGTQEMAGEENKEVWIERNIISDSGMVYYFVNWRQDRFEAADRNLFWRNGQKPTVGGELPLCAEGPDVLGRSEYSWESWKSILNGKFDVNTLNLPPMFVDESSGDYRLRSDSPAYLLGWRDIDWDRIGPVKGDRHEIQE